MTINNNNISFTGFIYPHHIFPKDAEKIQTFVQENSHRIIANNLETKFETDIRINDDLKTIAFLHRKYGNLEAFGIPKMLMEDLNKNADELAGLITQSLKKVEQLLQSHQKH